MREYTIKLTEAEISKLHTICNHAILGEEAIALNPEVYVPARNKAKKSVEAIRAIKDKLKKVVDE